MVDVKESSCVQVKAESDECQRLRALKSLPVWTTAASLVPSADEVSAKTLIEPAGELVQTSDTSVQVAPVSVDIKMEPELKEAATCLVASSDMVRKSRFTWPVHASVQVPPVSVDVQIHGVGCGPL